MQLEIAVKKLLNPTVGLRRLMFKYQGGQVSWGVGAPPTHEYMVDDADGDDENLMIKDTRIHSIKKQFALLKN